MMRHIPWLEKRQGGPIRAHGTTVVGVRRNNQVAFASDGQVSIGEAIMKHTSKKVQKVFKGKVLAGYAGAAADSLALLERFEGKLEESRGNLSRAVQQLARDWRMDRILRQLQALLLVANKEEMYLISGQGDVIAIEEEAAAIGSGGPIALAAARCLVKHTDLEAEEVAREALLTAASIDIYTNEEITLLTL